MNILLRDHTSRQFFPLTLTRSVADIRMGIFTIKERWEKVSGRKVFVQPAGFLQDLYEPVLPAKYLVIDPCLLPSKEINKKIMKLEEGEEMYFRERRIAFIEEISTSEPTENRQLAKKRIEAEEASFLAFPSDIFTYNDTALRFDFELITKGRKSATIAESNRLVNEADIFVEEGAKVSFSVLNASTGPIYIGKNATVMEGCLIRGPFVMGEAAVLKMGAKIYGATTLGPQCVAGGEIKNSVLFGYSNKAHDGYLGDTVLGEWCNLGAGTSNSNVKNTAGNVKTWNYQAREFVNAGLKCGVIMGDYCRTAINTSINTGTVIGVCSNVFGEGLTPKILPNFSWGNDGKEKYDFDKALKDIANWKKMKNKTLTETEKTILKHIFENHKD